MISRPLPQKWTQAFATLLSKTGLALIAIYAVFNFADQSLTDLMQNELMSEAGATSMIWVYGSLSFFLGLVSPLILTFFLLSLWRKPDQSPLRLAQDHLGFLLKEEMRVMGQSLLWGLAFILPGIFRFFQCLLVPFVVLLDSDYQLGKVDALARSWERIRPQWLKVFAVFLFYGVIMPLLMTSFDEYRSISEHPLSGIPLFFVELALVIMFQWSILKLWEKNHEADVSVV